MNSGQDRDQRGYISEQMESGEDGIRNHTEPETIRDQKPNGIKSQTGALVGERV